MDGTATSTRRGMMLRALWELYHPVRVLISTRGSMALGAEGVGAYEVLAHGPPDCGLPTCPQQLVLRYWGTCHVIAEHTTTSKRCHLTMCGSTGRVTRSQDSKRKGERESEREKRKRRGERNSHGKHARERV